ncbi:hypothetical protein BAUCODRAFT_43367, partial [Baudoinia panamericana UAMH 10762]
QTTPPETPICDPDAPELQLGEGLFHNYLRAIYPFDPSMMPAESEDALEMTTNLRAGDLVLVHSIHANGWADGTVLTTGERGWLPTNFCEAFDHPYLRNLLNAMTQFWDLLGATEDGNLSTFVRQDYVRGLIAGVRYLLEHADCLHRDAALVQRHMGIRRMRKGLLADLSSLVQIAKGLQETISEPFAGEVVHYLVDDLIVKACKVVTRAIGFVDIWSEETGHLSVRLKQTGRFERETLPSDERPFPFISSVSVTERPISLSTAAASQASATEEEEAEVNAAQEVEHAMPRSRTFSYRLASRRPSVAHRLSMVDTERTQHRTLASHQLARMHDASISHIAAFIGHHLHSRACSELRSTTERLVKACEEMLHIVDEIALHGAQRSDAVREARVDFQTKLVELISATQDVFTFSDLEDSQGVMLPEHSQRLVRLGTSLIRSASNCVGRTRSLIEQIGDFDMHQRAGWPTSFNQAAGSGAANLQKRGSGTEARVQSQQHVVTSFEKRLSKKMALPVNMRASMALLELEDTSNTTARVVSGLQTPETLQSPASPYFKTATPSVQQRATTRASQHQQAISGATLSFLRSAGLSSSDQARKDSAGLSIAGSTSTKTSSARHSGASVVSSTSTRATSPDRIKEEQSPDPALLNSFTSISSLQSVASDAPSDPETQLLQKTYANEMTVNNEGKVNGGSLPALVEKLTMHDAAPDSQFVSAFFLTFRMFTTPQELVQALVARFDYIGDTSAIGRPVRLRVYNVIKGWLETYWIGEADNAALGDIRYFAAHRLKPHLASAGDRLLELTHRVAAGYESGNFTGPLVSGIGKTSLSIVSSHAAGNATPEPNITETQLSSLRTELDGGQARSILEFDAVELARQITLLTSETFCRIQPDELLSLDWSKKDSHRVSNVRTMCTVNTDLAHVVGDSVLAPEDAKKRAQLIKHWSKIAVCCLELHNYDSVMAIMCSLNSSVLQRLRRTWELVSRKTKARLEELNAIIDFSRNHASLRKRLEEPVAPCIPFLGIYLTDLTFMNAGNPKMRDLPGVTTDDGQQVQVINFDKCRRMAKVVSHLQKFQVPYKLRPVAELQTWLEAHLDRMRASNDAVLGSFHRRSLLVEPKQE